jgi:hypothetical protein
VSRLDSSVYKNYGEAGAVYNALAVHKYAGRILWGLASGAFPALALMSAEANSIVQEFRQSDRFRPGSRGGVSGGRFAGFASVTPSGSRDRCPNMTAFVGFT